MIRHVVTVSSGTLCSRLLGFVRDSLVATLLGAGPIADAFLVAFQFINVTRRMLAEGALNAALVPGYLRARETGGVAVARKVQPVSVGQVARHLGAQEAALRDGVPATLALVAEACGARRIGGTL